MKKVLCLYILILSFLSGDIIAQDSWDGSIDESWPEDITQSEFTISTPAQLARLAQLVNDSLLTFEGKRIILANDIDLNNILWEPIGRMEYSDIHPHFYTVKKPFRGHFDGNNKTINNLVIEAKHPTSGLFGYIENGSKIENLILKGGKVNDDGLNVRIDYSYCLLATAALVGRIDCAVLDIDKAKRDSVIIRNCHNVSVEVNNALMRNDFHYANWNVYTSGLVGYVENYLNAEVKSPYESFFLIEDCTNNGLVSAKYTTAGVIGGFNNLANAVIHSCKNKGEINKIGNSPFRYVGGIIGSVEHSGQLMIDNCVNESKVIFNEGGGPTGGIIGTIRLENKKIIVENSLNSGGILSEGNAIAGGIIGNVHLSVSNNNDDNSLIIESCGSIGEVDTNLDATVGGIIGKVELMNEIISENKVNQTFVLSDCYFASTVYASYCKRIGGLIGELAVINYIPSFVPLKVNINNNYVVGSFEIEGGGTVGGLIGVLDLIDFSPNPSTGNPNPCRIRNNLVVLPDLPDYYNANRIIGAMNTAKSYISPLSENYAHVENRTFTDEIGHNKLNGEDWKGSMNAVPLTGWNTINDIVWEFDPTDKFMPKLANVSFDQPDVLNPMYGKGNVGIEPVAERPFRVSTSGSGLYINTDTPGDLSVYKFSGSLYTKRFIPAGLTTIQMPRDLYIVKFNGLSEKVVINK